MGVYSMFLDGGMRLLQLNPETGEKPSEAILNEIDPETGKNLHAYVDGLDTPLGRIPWKREKTGGI
jgi:hypothetical protein